MKDPADDKTIDGFEGPKKKRPGRKPRGKRALTDAEKQRAYRLRKAEESAQAQPVVETAEIEVADLIDLVRDAESAQAQLSKERHKFLDIQTKMFGPSPDPVDVEAYEKQKEVVKKAEKVHYACAHAVAVKLKFKLWIAGIKHSRTLP